MRKERAAGYYRLSAYYLAKSLSELPLILCYPTLFMIIVYWMAGLNRSEAFVGTLSVVLLTAITGQVRSEIMRGISTKQVGPLELVCMYVQVQAPAQSIQVYLSHYLAELFGSLKNYRRLPATHVDEVIAILLINL